MACFLKKKIKPRQPLRHVCCLLLYPVRNREAFLSFLTQQQFDGVSNYLITDKCVCEKIVVITAFDYTIVGYPVEITNEKVRVHDDD